MTFELVRVSIRKEGAFGVLLCDGVPFAVTLERTYDPDNSVKIAPGEYTCSKSVYYKGGYETYEIHVPGHTRILFHKANLETDLDGCVGVAKSFGMMGGVPGVASSKIGFNEFLALTNGASTFKLKVRNAS